MILGGDDEGFRSPRGRQSCRPSCDLRLQLDLVAQKSRACLAKGKIETLQRSKCQKIETAPVTRKTRISIPINTPTPAPSIRDTYPRAAGHSAIPRCRSPDTPWPRFGDLRQDARPGGPHRLLSDLSKGTRLLDSSSGDLGRTGLLLRIKVAVLTLVAWLV
jgi:hypothetical protein